MTTTTHRNDQTAKAAVLDALGRSGEQMARTLASCPDGMTNVPGLMWTVRDLTAHLVITLQELTRALLDEPTAYDGATVAGTSAAVDNRLVAEFPVRDMTALAGMFDIERARFTAALASLDPNHPVPNIAPNLTALALGAIFVIDHHNHGAQLARAGARPWQINLTDVRECVAAVVPASYNRQAAAHLHWRFALHLRGVTPLQLAVDHGTLVVGDVTGPVDVHISADPSAFLQQSAGGFITQTHMLLTGQLFAYGWRMWAMLALPKLLPPIQHGGKILHGAALRKAHQAARREVAMRDGRATTRSGVFRRRQPTATTPESRGGPDR